MIYIGIDPGAHGAVAAIDIRKGKVVRVDAFPFFPRQLGKASGMVQFDMAQARHDMKVARGLGGHAVAIERVGAMPGQGVVSMFSFGLNVGATQAIAEDVFDVAPHFVVPQVWKRYHNLLKQPKSASVDVAMTLYPEAVRLLAARGLCEAKEGSASFIGCCEALLIADWLRHQEVPA